MLHNYIIGVSIIATLVILFGFIVPYLISAANTELVLIGFVVIVFAVPFLYCMIKQLNFKKKEKVNEKN